eukprot:CAMPEP_0116011364 /NCGR_PEP_ID=MMETSP0321-20121206/4527_1 /TAXON_ID=163516 /ORGANISM="Leptocylindrus danicus var. danicus, Strain B650" /LENGTH=248 /DNA_ID=CAMNT_0003480589 /DNA_START=155 /DNA_END=901 /DNA_ORIENTATION=+
MTMTGLGELVERLNLATNARRCSADTGPRQSDDRDTTYSTAEQQTCYDPNNSTDHEDDMLFQYCLSRDYYDGEDAPDVEAISMLSSNDSIVDSVDVTDSSCSSSLYLYCESSASSHTNLNDIAEEGECDDEAITKSPLRRSVQFSHIEVREYDIELGDCPYCSYGPPITLGWNYGPSTRIEIDEYEGSKSAKMCRRGKELVLTLYQRKNLLRQFGYTNVDFRRFEPGLATSRMRRSGTSLNLNLASLM